MTPRVVPAIWGGCPRCTNNKVKLLPQGNHLAWDLHAYVTWGGARLPCSASAQRLCDLPARDVEYLTGKVAPLCIHPIPKQERP